MAKGATHPELKAAFTEHLEVTQGHVARLAKIFESLDASPKGKKCAAMQGLIAEGKELLDQKKEAEPSVLDAALIGAAQRVEHYEMAGYGCVRTFAKLLGLPEAARLLQETLDEEGEADENSCCALRLRASVGGFRPLPVPAHVAQAAKNSTWTTALVASLSGIGRTFQSRPSRITTSTVPSRISPTRPLTCVPSVSVRSTLRPRAPCRYLHGGAVAAPADRTEFLHSIAFRQKPNVYFMILDAYGRADTLKLALGFDNDRFLGELERLGFFIPRHSVSNYPATNASVASMLSLDYPEAAKTLDPDVASFRRELQGANPVVEKFKAEGYRYILVPGGIWTKISCGGEEDLCLEKTRPLEMERALTSLTPIQMLLDIHSRFTMACSDTGRISRA